QISKMFTHFENLVAQSITDEEVLVEAIDILSTEEKNLILKEFNDTEASYPQDVTLVELFEEQVNTFSDHIAVEFEGKTLTYKDLNSQSNQLGYYLRTKYDIQPDDLIAIKLDRSEQTIVSIMGVLKSGAGYVPIDPEYPQERISYIEEDTNA
ncbi:AMP-binding protein, partial [Flavobacterium sp. H122]|uniref:AMP-binding protein n=1 Tax=Flavobacterium sp. H122 TaxID=2529860 RepID=UPI0010AA0600